jgi:glycosyltransferase 2 family protein
MREPEALDPTSDTDAVGLHSLLVWLPGVVVLAALVWLVLGHLTEERAVADLFARARPRWLVVAALLQVVTYLTVGETWRAPLAGAGYVFRRVQLARLALLKLTVDQAVPTGGASGTIFMIHRLRRFGVPPDILGATMLIVLVGYYLAYAAGVVVAVAILWVQHGVQPLVALVATIFATLAAGLPLVLVWRACRPGWSPPGWLVRVPWFRELLAETGTVAPALLARSRLYAETASGSFMTMVLDAATLMATLAAVGARTDAFACFAALVMASVAATIGIMPGGLGTFEAGSVAVLTATGTAPAAALGGTLLLRGFTFWIPMLPGALMLRHR